MQSQQSNQPKKESKEEVSVSRFNLDQIPKPELSGHIWRQQGTMLLCESCPFTHSTYIPPDYQLIGVQEDGIPKLVKRSPGIDGIPEEAIGLTVAEYRKKLSSKL